MSGKSQQWEDVYAQGEDEQASNDKSPSPRASGGSKDQQGMPRDITENPWKN
jgi:hypothetical protein